MIKSAAELLAAGALRTAEITVCEVPLRIREMSVAAWRRIATDKPDGRAAACRMVQECVIDGDGACLFSPDDLEKIEGLRPELLDGIASAIMKLSGIKEKEDPGKD